MRPAESSPAACVAQKTMGQRKVTLYGRGARPLHANLRTASMSPRPGTVYLVSSPQVTAQCRPQMATLWMF
jgi:hypothetical protein